MCWLFRAWKASMRKALLADDPNMFPFGVRLFVVVLVLLCFFLVYLTDAPQLADMAVVGLFFGIAGAGTLYWESVMSGDDFRAFEYQLREYLTDRRIRILERAIAISFVFLGLYNMWPYIRQFTAELMCNDGGPISLLRLLLSIGFGLPPAPGAFLSIELPRRHYNKVMQGVEVPDEAAKVANIKRSVRQIGFLLFIVAGFMQWPVLVWG
jgi:hypothetical protein